MQEITQRFKYQLVWSILTTELILSAKVTALLLEAYREQPSQIPC